jgi:signal transduction histidine kinase
MGGTTSRRQLALAILMTAGVMAVGSAVPWLIPRADLAPANSGLEHMHAAMLFGAASLGLLSGRWVARTSFSFACAAFVVLAVAGAVSGTNVGQTGLGPVTTTSGAALAVILLFAAAAAPEVTDVASFRQLVTRECSPIALLALVALSPLIDALLMTGMFMPLPARMAFSALVAAGWLVAAIRVLRLRRPSLFWLPPVLLILSAEALVRAFVGMWPGSGLVAMGLKALAGVFALVGAAVAARTAFVSTTVGMTSMLQDLSTMRDEDSRRRADEIERLHEVRSVLAGLRAATGSLRKYEDSLDPGIRRRLEDAVGAELIRLNQLIDPGLPDLVSELDLGSIVMPVVLAEMQQGLVIATDIAQVTVGCTATQVATLVSDLLVNVRVHAPGSAALLTVEVDRGVVSLAVRDWGPGLSKTDAEHVFERSYRGALTIADGVPGSGIGLYNARRLVRLMHGDLHVLAPAGGGCCFVATIPVAGKRDEVATLPVAGKPDEVATPPVAAKRGEEVLAAKSEEILAALEADLSPGRTHVAQSIPRKDVRARQRNVRP